MILKTVTQQNYFATEFEKIARKLISQEGSPFDQNDQKNFIALSLGSTIEKIFRDFNYAYFNFPHFERFGMYDKFDDYSEKMLDSLINELQKLIPNHDKKLKHIYCLTCSQMLNLIKQDLELLGDEEFIKLINSEDIKILSWLK